ncbi:MAG: hypothetical protein COX55_05800 [Zetaproteobacteria bacterium CG23_combo_of_CG06-09_8_20_14_all_54_7]|nr:MAG: hypothetical protein COX55_05800 [Zetaproteobacteria bacterium CG23_combo_of_CG06-09_8_20_14_all_54_7]
MVNDQMHVMAESGLVITDYRIPDALMVPHYQCDLTSLLEEIASRVSRYCGVILLSSDSAFSQAFIETRERPDHFSIVTAAFDSPWIRDRSPVAIKVKGAVRWCIPLAVQDERPNDNQLFHTICATKHPLSPIPFLPQGNMVVGSRGLMLVSNDVLKHNHFTVNDLENCKAALGIRHWLVFSGFSKEMTGHADVHVRVLKANLIAVAWNLSSKSDRNRCESLIQQIKNYDATIEIIKIPIRSDGNRYGSLVNWLQIGKRLLLPRYDITVRCDISETTALLSHHGFTVEYIYSPTLHYAGSLHCLTASIYI